MIKLIFVPFLVAAIIVSCGEVSNVDNTSSAGMADFDPESDGSTAMLGLGIQSISGSSAGVDTIEPFISYVT